MYVGKESTIEKLDGCIATVTMLNGEKLTGQLQTSKGDRWTYVLKKEELDTLVIRRAAVLYLRVDKEEILQAEKRQKQKEQDPDPTDAVTTEDIMKLKPIGDRI